MSHITMHACRIMCRLTFLAVARAPLSIEAHSPRIILFARVDGEEEGIRAQQDLVIPASCRIHNATVPTDAVIAMAYCTPLHAQPRFMASVFRRLLVRVDAPETRREVVSDHHMHSVDRMLPPIGHIVEDANKELISSSGTSCCPAVRKIALATSSVATPTFASAVLSP
jgi:hypothetical protein